MEEDEWRQEDGRTQVLPICQLNGGVVGVRQRKLDEDGVNCDEQGGQNAVDNSTLAWGSEELLRNNGLWRNTEEESESDDDGSEEYLERRYGPSMKRGDRDGQWKYEASRNLRTQVDEKMRGGLRLGWTNLEVRGIHTTQAKNIED